MIIEPIKLDGAFVIRLEPRIDERGFFARSFCELEFAEKNLPTRFPQCNISRNQHAGTLRGMHYETPPSKECKLVRCAAGSIYDVIIDLRPNSPTRFEWFGVELNRKNGVALFIPAEFAHGFLTLADDTDVHYHMGDFYHATAANGLRYNDPFFAIRWPREPAVISTRDQAYPDFSPDGSRA